MELNIKDFDELESYFKRKAQHVEELESENTELTIENRKLHQEIDRLTAETDDKVRNMSNTDIIPRIFRKREQ